MEGEEPHVGQGVQVPGLPGAAPTTPRVVPCPEHVVRDPGAEVGVVGEEEGGGGGPGFQVHRQAHLPRLELLGGGRLLVQGPG